MLVTDVLQKMVKQRRESITMFEQGGRQELADIEASEVAVIEDFLPAQLSDDEATAAIKAIVVELGATSLTDMGKVLAEGKDRTGSQLDKRKESRWVKAAVGCQTETLATTKSGKASVWGGE